MSIKIAVDTKSGSSTIAYAGPLNEEAGVHLSTLYDTASKKCVFNFKNLGFINSSGIRTWINFLRDFRNDRDVQFEECSPEMVFQINMIPSFAMGVNIKSVYAHYICTNCEHKSKRLFQLDRLDKPDGQPTSIRCEKCQGSMDMEEDPEDFFAFIKRQSA